MIDYRLVRGVGLRGAVAINVISMIGIGPLITIPLVLGALHGPLSLVGWLAGVRWMDTPAPGRHVRARPGGTAPSQEVALGWPVGRSGHPAAG